MRGKATGVSNDSLFRALTDEHPMLRDIPMCIIPPYTEWDVRKWKLLDERERRRNGHVG